MFFYSIYGLTICANKPISWFQKVAASRQIDIDFEIEFEGLSERSVDINWVCDVNYFTDNNTIETEVGTIPLLTIKTNADRDTYYFSFFDGVEVLIDNIKSRIIFRWPSAEILEFELGYLTACVMSFVLLLRGTFSFHASAIAIDGKAIMLVGDSGAGKSTTAAAFAKLGYPILSDDLVAIRDDIDKFWVQPSFPLVRLWAKSVSALFGRADALPEIVPNHPTWNKQYLRLDRDPYRFQDRELPLGGIYFLNSRNSDNNLLEINSISIQETLLFLVANNYSAQFVDKPSRAREFEMLGRLLQQVSARQVVQGNNIDRLFQLCETISNDFKQIV